MGFTRKNGEGRWRSVFFFATVVIVVVSYGGQGGRGGKTPIAGAGIIKSHLRLYYGNAIKLRTKYFTPTPPAA